MTPKNFKSAQMCHWLMQLVLASVTPQKSSWMCCLTECSQEKSRALAIEPELVFFDEPTSGLDPITSASIDALIRQLQSTYDVTFVVITHDVQSAAAIADNVAVLDHGELLAFGPQKDVWRHPNEVVQALIQRQPLGTDPTAT